MRNLWRAFKLILPHRWMLVWYLLTAAGLAIFSSLPLVLIKSFLSKLERHPVKDKLAGLVDDFLTTYVGTTGDAYIKGLCVLLLVCWLLKALFDFANTYLTAWMAQRLRMEAMDSVMRKLLTLDHVYFDRSKIGDLVTRMVSDGDNLRKTVKVFLDIIQQPFLIAALVGVAVYYDWKLFLVGGIFVPVVVVPLQRIIRNITRQTRRYQEKTADLAQAMLQNLAGIRIIHAYNASDKEASNFSRVAKSLFRTGMRRNLMRAIQSPLTSLVLGLGLILVLWYGGASMIDDARADVGRFIAVVSALGMLYSPINAMVSALGELAELLPSAERTFEVIDVKSKIAELPGAVECPALGKEIVFENVSFDYGRGMVLRDLNLTVHAGEKIGIVGRTGVGKSTLLALLLRFYDPSSGRITIDGIDIKSVRVASLRSQMALVNQNCFLFHNSVMENIRYGRDGATDAEVIEAARIAMIHDEIMQQPEGYKTFCGERGGELFSGGQRQRIAVARAILRNAPILLLDEATSHLDPFSERRVQEALEKMTAQRTSLIVAHRLSTLRNVDRIIVFSEGGGVEAVAPHQELLQISPTYRRLWAEQQSAGESGTRPAAEQG